MNADDLQALKYARNAQRLLAARNVPVYVITIAEAAIDAAIARLDVRRLVNFRSIDDGREFTIGEADTAPGATGRVGGTPALRLLHAALARPHTALALDDFMIDGLPVTTARARLRAAIKRLDASVTGLAAVLLPDKARGHGVSVRGNRSVVFKPRPGSLLIRAIDSDCHSFV